MQAPSVLFRVLSIVCLVVGGTLIYFYQAGLGPRITFEFLKWLAIPLVVTIIATWLLWSFRVGAMFGVGAMVIVATLNILPTMLSLDLPPRVETDERQIDEAALKESIAQISSSVERNAPCAPGGLVVRREGDCVCKYSNTNEAIYSKPKSGIRFSDSCKVE